MPARRAARPASTTCTGALAVLLLCSTGLHAQVSTETYASFIRQLVETTRRLDGTPGRLYILDIRTTDSVPPRYSAIPTPEHARRVREAARAIGIEAVDVFEELSCPADFDHPNDCHFLDHRAVVAIRVEELELFGDSARVPYKFFVQDRPNGMIVLNRWVDFVRRDGRWVLTRYAPLMEH